MPERRGVPRASPSGDQRGDRSRQQRARVLGRALGVRRGHPQRHSPVPAAERREVDSAGAAGARGECEAPRRGRGPGQTRRALVVSAWRSGVAPVAPLNLGQPQPDEHEQHLELRGRIVAAAAPRWRHRRGGGSGGGGRGRGGAGRRSAPAQLPNRATSAARLHSRAVRLGGT